MDTIDVTMNGTEVSLVPSVKAAKELSKKYHGLLPVMDHLNLGNLAVATDVCFWGLSKKDEERDQLMADVFSAGLSYLTPHLVRFMIALSNGGKVPAAPVANPVAAEAVASAG